MFYRLSYSMTKLHRDLSLSAKFRWAIGEARPSVVAVPDVVTNISTLHNFNICAKQSQ